MVGAWFKIVEGGTEGFGGRRTGPDRTNDWTGLH